MMCYRDRTFCPYGKLCKKADTCKTVLTEKVEADALLWWGKPNPPICIYADFPQCFERVLEME